jgi:signal transduction histidine kinase
MEKSNLVIALILLTACAGGVWLRVRLGRSGTPAAALAQAGWCSVLLAVALVIAGLQEAPFYGSYLALFIVPLVIAVILVGWPRLGYWLAPPALMVLSGFAFAAVRQYGYGLPGLGAAPGVAARYVTWVFLAGYLPGAAGAVGRALYYLALPLAYGLAAVGGWLAWRAVSRRPALAAELLGPLAKMPGALLLVLVLAMAAELGFPNQWFGGGVLGVTVTLLLIAAALGLARRRPGWAQGLATGGLIAVGAAGLFAAVSWLTWSSPQVQGNYVMDGLVSITGPSTAQLGIIQSLILITAGLLLAPHTIPAARRLGASYPELMRRVQRLTETRAVAVDTAAADLRRLERDLHDGAQARLVALGMNLRAVERLIPDRPDAALALVAEARQTATRALAELRELVRGVHPPVLADRGLGDALRALALDTPLRVDTEIDVPARLPGPVETACYFAVAELLTNAAKHSGAREGRLTAGHDGRLLRICVTDYGIGGADPARGSGLAGLEKRLAAFDGIVAVSSPVGGPTLVVLEVPCASSSPKISSC